MSWLIIGLCSELLKRLSYSFIKHMVTANISILSWMWTQDRTVRVFCSNKQTRDQFYQHQNSENTLFSDPIFLLYKWYELSWKLKNDQILIILKARIIKFFWPKLLMLYKYCCIGQKTTKLIWQILSYMSIIKPL